MGSGNRALRLRKRSDFEVVFRCGKSRAGAHLSVIAMPNGLTHARLGLAVSKKVAALAIERNYMKRVLREAFRASRPQLPSMDIVALARKAFRRGSAPAICAEFWHLVGELQA